ncbi:metallophosphoesterase family protein [bacterium]|nr:metallophosphoesterase family protein [bacterium]
MSRWCILLLSAGLAASRAGAFDAGPWLTWQGDPRSTVTLSWMRDAVATCTIEYCAGAAPVRSVELVCTGGLHSAMLTGLVAGTRYDYTMTWDDGAAVTNSFRTAPECTGPFSFGMMADTRTYTETHQAVADALLARQPHLCLNAGDAVEYGLQPEHWQSFLAIERALIARAPLAIAPGNHDEPETPGTLLWDLFPLPPAATSHYYSFTVGAAHFVALNTLLPVEGAQSNWLAADLAAARAHPDIAWIICFFHYPPYGAAAERDPAAEAPMIDALRGAWCPLFEQFGVQLVLNGHNHFYHRSLPVNGVTYITSGGGGAELHTPAADDHTAFATSCYQCLHVEVSEAELVCNAVGTDGAVFDTVTLYVPEPVAALAGALLLLLGRSGVRAAARAV